MSELNGKGLANDLPEDVEIPIRDRLNAETGVLSWDELAPHFARGVVLFVSSELDLITVAEKIIADDTTTVQAWMSANQVRRATDDDARDWVERTPNFWCVVSAPWVLAQEKSSNW